MMLDQTHKEDVKAVLRKRYRTVAAFIEAKGLPKTGVSDLFRGRTSRRVREAIEEVLQDEVDSMKLDASEKRRRPHRLNAGGR